MGLKDHVLSAPQTAVTRGEQSGERQPPERHVRKTRHPRNVGVREMGEAKRMIWRMRRGPVKDSTTTEQRLAGSSERDKVARFFLACRARATANINRFFPDEFPPPATSCAHRKSTTIQAPRCVTERNEVRFDGREEEKEEEEEVARGWLG